MRVLLLVNATASSVTARKRVLIRKALAARHEVEVAETSRRGHASRLARAAANDGFDVVAVLAGDGTLNEAADGLLHTDTALAPLPGGSTNVYAHALGVPRDALEATSVLLASLERRAFKRIGVGMANNRLFLFNLGVGFDAMVIRRVERYGEMKRYASHPLHVIAGLDMWFRTRGSVPRFTITLDTGEHIDGVGFAIVSKMAPYTYLGHRALTVAPAGLDDPLYLTAFQRLDAITLLGAITSSMRSGRFLRRHRGIVHRRELREMTIISAKPFGHQVDGDDLGDTDRIEVTYEPNVLTLVVP